MSIAAKGTLEVSEWVETAVAEAQGQAKQATAHSLATFSGDLSGSGRSDWLLTYPADGPAYFVGTQRFEGTAEGREGGFVLQVNGTFDGAGAHVKWSVVPGSGWGAFAGISGQGGYENADFTLEYELA